MDRIQVRIDCNIPPSQAAYRSGRSTTEQVFALKIAAERTVSTKDEELHLILLDMSKAFDSMNRKKLLEDLSEIIGEDELQIIQLMLNVNIIVRCGNEYSEPFETDTGGPQGDSSSAKEFTCYLAKAMNKYYSIRHITSPNHPAQHLIDHQYH